MTVKTTIQHRRGDAALWTSQNSVLASGEIGFETDTLKFKIGDGTTAWNSLAYQSTDTSLFAQKTASQTFTGTQTFIPASAAAKAVIIRGASGQSTDLQQWQDSTGTSLVRLTQTGTVIAPGIAVLMTAPANTGFSVRGAASQTGNLQSWSDSSSTILAKMDATGNFTAASLIKNGGTSSQFLKADGSVDSKSYSAMASSDTAPSSPAIGDEWFNSTNGKTYIWYGSAWVQTASAGPYAAVPNIGSLTGVAIGSTSDNDILSFDSATGNWTNQTAAAAGVATAASPTFTGTVTTPLTTAGYVKTSSGGVLSSSAAIPATDITGLTDAWTAYTPTVSSGLTVGNGTWSSAYVQIGKTVHARIRFTLGSTSAVTGALSLGLPVTGTVASYSSGLLTAAGTSYPAAVLTGTSSVNIYAQNAAGTYLTRTNTSATIPNTWTTGDLINISITYEAA